MECREVRQLADPFVSEQLLVETTQAVVAHLDRCPACRAEVDALRRLRLATRSAFERSPDLRARPEFLAAVTARLQAEAARQRPAPRRWLTWRLAAAASLLLLVGVGFGLREWSTAVLTELLHAAVGDHRFCALTFKLEERPITLEEAAIRYDVVYRSLAAVEPSTDTLSGGPLRVLERHSCVFNGRRFAHIVLRYKGQPVSLLVADDERPGDALWRGGRAVEGTTSTWPVTGGFHVASFRGSRHVVFVVSSLGDEDVQEVAQAIVGPVSRALAGA